jgi:NAD dependent epimerase/dehydratase family enzyme
MREQATLLLGSRRVHPERVLEAGYGFIEWDLERSLRRALGR